MVEKPTYEELEKKIQELNSTTVEFKRVKGIIKEKEEFNDILLNNFPHPIIIINSDTSVRYVNQALEQLTGYSSEEILGTTPPYIWWTESTQKKTHQNFYEALQTGAKKFEELFIKKNGEQFWVEITSMPTIVNEKIYYYLANWVDITKHKQTEEALRKSEERYKGLFINSKSGVAIYEVKGDAEDFIFTDFNKAAEKIDNQKKETLIGRSIFEARPQIEEFGLIDALRKVWKTGEPEHCLSTLYQDGKLNSWYENFVYKLPSGEIVVIFTDETDRMRAEEAFQIEHDKLKSILNGMGESIYIVNEDLNIEFQNNLFLKLFGNNKGKKCYKTIFKRNDPCLHCQISKALRTNSIQQKEINLYGGKYFDLTFSPLEEKNKTDKVIVFMRDITEQKFFRAEAIRAGHLASLGELAAGVAHEINNPITGIITIAEVLSNTFHKMGKDVELPNLIIAEGERIGQIVKNLLSFARDREEEHNPLQINDILNDTLALTQKQILKDGIHFSVDISPDIPKIKARAQEIQQVFLNIISNARYALNKRFPKPNKDKIFKISIKTIGSEKNIYVRLIFYDRGTGIAKDIIDKIKDPFFSTKPKGEGTGLGLSISHGIISSHNGILWFESQEKKYTKIMIDLPVHNK